MRFKFWKLFIPAGSVYIPSQCDGALNVELCEYVIFNYLWRLHVAAAIWPYIFLVSIYDLF